MAKYDTEHSVLTPTSSTPAIARRGKAGERKKGQTASKRKQATTRPGREHDEADHQFKSESWTATTGVSGRSPRAVQTKHPPKSPRKKGQKPTLH